MDSQNREKKNMEHHTGIMTFDECFMLVCLSHRNELCFLRTSRVKSNRAMILSIKLYYFVLDRGCRWQDQGGGARLAARGYGLRSLGGVQGGAFGGDRC